VLETRRRTLGVKHPDSLQSMFDLAAALQAQGKYGEAEPLYAESVDGSREAIGREHRLTLARMERLAAVRMLVGKYDQSAALYTEVLEIRRRVTGGEAAETVSDMVALGAVLDRLRNFREAEPLLREALTIREKSVPQTWGRFNAASLLGISIAGQKRLNEAESLLLSGVQGMLDHRGEIPQQVRFYLDSGIQALVHLYQDLGQPEKAIEWQRKLAPPK
jgi:tetratricopeptide (TPR) repeat protein